MLPVIGITSSASVKPPSATIADKSYTVVPKTYVNAVIAAGGLPVVLPNKPGFEAGYLAALDGILFSGGGDVQGKYFNQETHEKATGISEERDAFEIALAKLAYAAKKPILGICRGEQVINIALGGDIIQHMEGHGQHDNRSTLNHALTVVPGTMLHKWLGSDEIRVNSFHHQVVGKLAPGFAATAHSTDNYIEAYEYTGADWFCAAYQWHPEAMLESPEHALQIQLFKPFIEACRAMINRN